MSFKEKFNNHPVIFGLTLIVTGFGAGFTAHSQLNTNKSIDSSAIESHKKVDCQKLNEYISFKKVEAKKKENEMFMASPLSIGDEIDENSLYSRRSKELDKLQNQLETANIKYIQCLSTN